MKIMNWIALIMIACSLICGLWMKFAQGEKDANFHAMLSLATIIVCMITIIIDMIHAQ